jgi:hypothetical protein
MLLVDYGLAESSAVTRSPCLKPCRRAASYFDALGVLLVQFGRQCSKDRMPERSVWRTLSQHLGILGSVNQSMDSADIAVSLCHYHKYGKRDGKWIRY